MPILKQCRNCGKLFQTSPSKTKRVNCSMRCLKEYLKNNPHFNFQGKTKEFECWTCKKKFSKYYWKKTLRTFCSWQCSVKGRTGKNNYFFKTGKSKMGGYIYLAICLLNEEEQNLAKQMTTARRANLVAEHRLVVAKFLNRPLRNNEIVHHKNQKRDDNRLENLELIVHKGAHHHSIECPNCKFVFGLS